MNEIFIIKEYVFTAETEFKGIIYNIGDVIPITGAEDFFNTYQDVWMNFCDGTRTIDLVLTNDDVVLASDNNPMEYGTQLNVISYDWYKDKVMTAFNSPLLFEFVETRYDGVEDNMVERNFIQINEESVQGDYAYFDGTNWIPYTPPFTTKKQSTYRPRADGGTTLWSTHTIYNYGVNVSGANVGDCVIVNPESNLATNILNENTLVVFTGYVSSANTVNVIVKTEDNMALNVNDAFRITVL